MLLVYNYVLLKMSTWCSKHVEESNIILRINNIQCITLVVLYGQFMMHGQRNIKLNKIIVTNSKSYYFLNKTLSLTQQEFSWQNKDRTTFQYKINLASHFNTSLSLSLSRTCVTSIKLLCHISSWEHLPLFFFSAVWQISRKLSSITQHRTTG